MTGSETFVEVPRKRGQPRITLLSPTRQTLDDLYRVWAKELPKLKVLPEPEPLATPRSGLDVEALARRVTPEDRAPANGSSATFLLEHRGASALLTADAFLPSSSAPLPCLRLADSSHSPGRSTLSSSATMATGRTPRPVCWRRCRPVRS